MRQFLARRGRWLVAAWRCVLAWPAGPVDRLPGREIGDRRRCLEKAAIRFVRQADHGADLLAMQKDRIAQHVRRENDRRGDDLVFADAEAPPGNGGDRHSPPALSVLRRRAAAWLRRRATSSSLQSAAISVSCRRSALASSARSSSVVSLSSCSRVHVATRPRGSTRSFGGLIRSEEHTSELQSPYVNSYAGF